MPDWKSMEELQKDSVIFVKLMHAIVGLYAWELFLSLDFDWQYISGKKKFRWPLIFYFADRYLLFFALIGILIALDTTTPIDCQALYAFNQLAGDAAVGLASINLSIRTIAVWSRNKWIIGLLVLIIMGHWSLILQGVLINAEWSDAAKTCIITETHNTVLAATFIYSMCFDFIVLMLTGYKLMGIGSRVESGVSSGLRTPMTSTSRLGKMIFSDGLIYFLIAFIANLVATIFMLLDLNQIMSVIFNVPAAVASTIVACRAVRRLTNFNSVGAEIYGASSAGQTASNIAFRSGAGNQVAMSRNQKQTKSGVHVQMETFTRHEEGADQAEYVDPTKRQTVIFMPDILHSDKNSDTDIEAKGTL